GMEGEGGKGAEVAFGDGEADLVGGVGGEGEGDVEAEGGDQVGAVAVEDGQDREGAGAGGVGEGVRGGGEARAGRRQARRVGRRGDRGRRGSSAIWRRSTTTRARPGRSVAHSAIVAGVRSGRSSMYSWAAVSWRWKAVASACSVGVSCPVRSRR